MPSRMPVEVGGGGGNWRVSSNRLPVRVDEKNRCPVAAVICLPLVRWTISRFVPLVLESSAPKDVPRVRQGGELEGGEPVGYARDQPDASLRYLTVFLQ